MLNGILKCLMYLIGVLSELIKENYNMNVYVLIKTEMDDDFSYEIVCGVYTEEGKKRFEQSLPEKGRKLKEQLRQGHMENINWFSEMLSRNSSNSKIDAFNNIMERKVDDAKRSLISLDDYQTDEQLKKFYMQQEGYNWQQELLVDG